MKTSIIFFCLLFVFFGAFCQNQTSKFIESPVSLNLEHYTLYGTLTIPTQKTKKMMVALFIAGSGPTDRNGNNTAGLNTYAYQKFCHSLAEKGIATLRFDKWGTGESKPQNAKEMAEKRDFDSEVSDAVAWIEFLKKDKQFKEILLITHSQGTLVGILAAQKMEGSISKLVSLAGVGRKGSETLKEQLSAQPKFVSDSANPIIDSLVSGFYVKNIPQFLEVLFKPSMQPYVISWFKYDPADELAKLAIPSLIIQGTSDIQIKVEDAKYLASKSKNAKLLIIEKMNHVLKTLESDDMNLNLATYNQPDLPITKELVEKVSDFILKK
jgi:pimeloyl-ACP methyl ester carboxylesterase